MAGLNLLAQITDRISPFGVNNCVHGHMLSLLALGFTHQKGLSNQIFELEDSGLPQQGILPISARKTWQTTFVWKKILPTVLFFTFLIHDTKKSRKNKKKVFEEMSNGSIIS